MTVGRKAVPDVQKKQNGNPGKRPLNKNAPEFHVPMDIPDPPFWLGEYGVEEWNRVLPHLLEAGVVTEADLGSFADYCQNYHIIIEASKDINKKGMTIMGSRGPVRNPALAAFSAASTNLRQLASEFGMTPSSRSKVTVPGHDGESLEDILSGGHDDDDIH